MISIFLCVQSIRLKSFLTIQMMTIMSNSSYKNKHISFRYIIKRWLIQSKNAFFMISSMILKRSLFMTERIIDAYKQKLRFIFCIWRSETFNLKIIHVVFWFSLMYVNMTARISSLRTTDMIRDFENRKKEWQRQYIRKASIND